MPWRRKKKQHDIHTTFIQPTNEREYKQLIEVCWCKTMNDGRVYDNTYVGTNNNNDDDVTGI